MQQLGRLEAVDPRSVWADEARDFTPWLFRNADVLAEALGLDVEFTAKEHPVGGYSLDLFGRDLTNDCVLIVENQLDQSDHTHLGQIITYAGGTDAFTLLWVAPRFRQEHLAAVDWINDRTDEDTRVFAVEIGLRKIGSSPPAPFLDVVGKPNDWHKGIRASARSSIVSETGEKYLLFWERYVARVRSEHPDWRPLEPAPRNHNNHWVPFRGSVLTPSFSDRKRIGVRMWIDSGDRDENREVFEAIRTQSEQFEHVFSEAIVWDDREGRRACDVSVYARGSIKDEDRLDEYLDWFVDTEEKFREVLDLVELPDHLRR